MARSLVLVVSAQSQRLEEHHASIHGSGRWWVLPAPTLERALAVLHRVRPAVVVYDAPGADGWAQPLHQTLHGGPLYTDVHLLLLGALPPARHPALGGDSCPHCTSCPHCAQIYPRMDSEGLVTLLHHVVDGTPVGEKYAPDDDTLSATGAARHGRDDARPDHVGH